MNIADLPSGASEPFPPLDVAEALAGCDVYHNGHLFASYDQIPDTRTLARTFVAKGIPSGEVKFECYHRNFRATWDMHYKWDKPRGQLRLKR